MIAPLARRWASELHASRDEVEHLLLSAFWRGELPALVEGSAYGASDIRTKVLDIISRTAEHPRVLFLSPRDRIGPRVVDLPDGSSEVDLRIRVFWPPDADAADRSPCAACEALAEAEFTDFSEAAENLLRMISFRQEDFGSFCSTAGYDLPRFWFHRTATQSVIAAESKCRRWLRDQVSKSDKPASKARLMAQARALFPDLSARGFERIWKDVAPPSWRKSGAPKRKRLLTAMERA